jgi:hypothetical protein
MFPFPYVCFLIAHAKNLFCGSLLSPASALLFFRPGQPESPGKARMSGRRESVSHNTRCQWEAALKQAEGRRPNVPRFEEQALLP